MRDRSYKLAVLDYGTAAQEFRKGQLFAKTEYVKVPIGYRTDRHIIRKVNVYSVKSNCIYLIYKFFIQAGVKYFLPQSSIKIRSPTPYI